MDRGYTVFAFQTEGYDSEVLLALLNEREFEAFSEEDNTLLGYIANPNVRQELIETLDSWQGQWHGGYTREAIPHRNWNEVWESSFQPVAVDKYCYIRAAFHDPAPAGFKHEIVIAPRMAFGTGHHATTFMMLQAMSSLDFRNKVVLDFGCGTGILAVVAALEGADHVLGVDIQPEAIENSLEHADLHGVIRQCQFLKGGLDLAAGQTFDIILANINSHVIAGHINELKDMLKPGGYLLLSGIMIYDRPMLGNDIAYQPLEMLSEKEKGEWLQLTLKKSEKQQSD